MRDRRSTSRRGLLLCVAAALFVVVIQTASAGSTAVIDGATANGLCTTS
jgi:hypothetical protein